jgi:hypothetical protein
VDALSSWTTRNWLAGSQTDYIKKLLRLAGRNLPNQRKGEDWGMIRALNALEIWLAKLWYSLIDGLAALFSKASKPYLVYTTQEGVEIFVEPGSRKDPQKFPHDFKVSFRDRRFSSRLRTPRHIHLIVELYVKEAYDKTLTYKLRDHLLWVYDQIKPISSFPPSLQVFQPCHIQPFKSLDSVGEFSVEFLLVVSELIFIQEKTNYPGGSLTKQLYEEFGRRDRFSVIHKALLGR